MKWLYIVVGISLAIVLLPTNSEADNHRAQYKDQSLSITASGCGTTLRRTSVDNCIAEDAMSRDCSDASCICTTKNKFVTWQGPSGTKFKLKFNGKSPLKDNCGKNFKKGQLKCKIKENIPKGNYDYEVVLEGCARGDDPRIVIK